MAQTLASTLQECQNVFGLNAGLVQPINCGKLRFGQMSDARTLSDDTKLKLATLPVTARPQAGKDGTSTNSAKPDAFDSQDVPSGMSVGSLVPSAISIGEGSGMSDTVDPKPSSSPENNASSVGDQMRRSILSTTGVDLDEKKKHESKKCEIIGIVDSCSGFAIMLNAVHIGGQANCAMSASCYTSVEMMNVIDLVFALGFALELAIRRRLTTSWGSFYCTHEDAHLSHHRAR